MGKQHPTFLSFSHEQDVLFWVFSLVGNENSVKDFLTEVFLNCPGVVDVRAFGHGRPRRHACFSRILRAWPKFLPLDVRRDIRVDVRRISGPETYSLGCFFVPDLPTEAFKVIFDFAGYFYMLRGYFLDPPTIRFKTCIKWTFPRLFLPGKVIFALQGKRINAPKRFWGYGKATKEKGRLKWRPPPKLYIRAKVETFRGATEPFQPDLPLRPRPLAPDLFRTWFWPDFDLIRTWNPPFQVRIRSKSGPNQVWGEGSGPEG